MAAKIRKDDRVEVISGAHKGQQGKVLKVDPEKEMVTVQDVNTVYKHLRPSRRHPQGGRIQRESPIHISNVLPVDPKTGRGARVRFEVERDAKGKQTAKRRVTVNGTVLEEARGAKGGRSGA